MGRTSVKIIVGMLMTASLVLPAGTAFHSDAPILLADTGDGSTGWGVEVALASAGDIEIDLHGDLPVTASQVSAGGVFFDGEGNPTFMIAITSHTSPQRTQLTPNPLEGILEPAAQGIIEPTVVTTGDRDQVPFELDIALETQGTDANCPFVCLALNAEDAEPGDHHFVLWMGGLGSTELTVRSTGQGAATVDKGPSYVLGDPELDGGTVNAQVQRSVGGQTVGVKAMLDVPFETSIEERLWGFWSHNTIKLACQALCFTPTTAFEFCSQTTANLVPGVACDTASLGWDGPGESGESGGSFFAFRGEPAGDYAFVVEHKLDAYGPIVFNPGTNTFVFLGEDHSFLSVTDVAVP